MSLFRGLCLVAILEICSSTLAQVSNTNQEYITQLIPSLNFQPSKVNGENDYEKLQDDDLESGIEIFIRDIGDSQYLLIFFFQELSVGTVFIFVDEEK